MQDNPNKTDVSSTDGQPERLFKYAAHDSDTIAFARIKGGPLSPRIRGIVLFKAVSDGTEVCVEVEGLPAYRPAYGGNPPIGPHGFHIHEFGDCIVGTEDNPFAEAGGHWNPSNQPHGNHAGDLPVLFSNRGYARMSVFTSKFRPEEVVGKAIIIHESPDDYRSQPAGASGKRLACGVIRRSMNDANQ